MCTARTTPANKQLALTSSTRTFHVQYVAIRGRVAIVVRLIHLQSSSSTLCCIGERSNTPSGRNCWYRNVRRTIKLNTVDCAGCLQFRSGCSIAGSALITCFIHARQVDIGTTIERHSADCACCLQFCGGGCITCQRSTKSHGTKRLNTYILTPSGNNNLTPRCPASINNKANVYTFCVVADQRLHVRIIRSRNFASRLYTEQKVTVYAVRLVGDICTTSKGWTIIIFNCPDI